MSEKRFTLKHYEDTDWAYDNGKPIYTKEMVELLNEQHETITKQKKQICDYHMENGMLIESEKEYKMKVKETLQKCYNRSKNNTENQLMVKTIARLLGVDLE